MRFGLNLFGFERYAAACAAGRRFAPVRTAGVSFYPLNFTQKGTPHGVPFCVAQREGFEPPDSFPSTVFKTAAFDHSAISA